MNGGEETGHDRVSLAGVSVTCLRMIKALSEVSA